MSKSVYKSGPYREETGPFGETEMRVMYQVCDNSTDHNTFIVKRADGSFETVFTASDEMAFAMLKCNVTVHGDEATEVMKHYGQYQTPTLGVAAAAPSAGPSAVSTAKTPEDAAAVPNAKEWEKPVLGYFDFLGGRYMLTRIDGGMLVGYNIKNGGGVDTLHIHRDNVRALVMINNN